MTNLRGALEENVPLLHHTSWRVGGPARYFFQPADQEDLTIFLTTASTSFAHKISSKEPIFWLGLGSNLLIRDGGYPGIVVSMLSGFTQMTQLDSLIVRAEAGVSCAKLARFCARLGLVGGEFLAGIPGTFGGALAMNAGCFGGETWELVTQVETMNRAGEVLIRKPSSFKIAYRDVQGLQDECFISGYLQLRQGDKETSLEKIRELLARRAATQPTGDHSCGSVFRNPPGDYAGRLIELCGLKGLRHGGAYVSEKHANFIINEGNATAADIETVIAEVASTVKRSQGVDLKTEVKIIGVKG